MFRISGTITAVDNGILTADAVKPLIYEIMPERNRVESEQTNDTDFAYELVLAWGNLKQGQCHEFPSPWITRKLSRDRNFAPDSLSDQGG